MGLLMMGMGFIFGDFVIFIEDGYMMGMKVKLCEIMSKKGLKEIFYSVEMD